MTATMYRTPSCLATPKALTRTARRPGCPLDVDRMTISHHAVCRYLQRRGQRDCPENYEHARLKLRELLAKCSSMPPLVLSEKGVVRKFRASGFTFIVSADCSALITFFAERTNKKGRR